MGRRGGVRHLHRRRALGALYRERDRVLLGLDAVLEGDDDVVGVVAELHRVHRLVVGVGVEDEHPRVAEEVEVDEEGRWGWWWRSVWWW